MVEQNAFVRLSQECGFALTKVKNVARNGVASRVGLVIAIASFSATCVTLFLYFWPIYEVMPHSAVRDHFIGRFIKISLILLATVLLPATLCILTFPLYVWSKKSGYAGSRLYEVAAPFCWLATFVMTYLLRQV